MTKKPKPFTLEDMPVHALKAKVSKMQSDREIALDRYRITTEQNKILSAEEDVIHDTIRRKTHARR